MPILNRYISLKFTHILIFAILGFISIFIIVDLIENLDTFINNEYPTKIVIEFYLNYIPFILVLILPVAMLISALFSIGNMARQNEIMAMKAAGISLYRIFTPLFLISILVSFLAMGIANYLVPRATERQTDLREQYEERRPRKERLDNVYIRDENDRRISMRYYNVHSHVGNTVSIRKFTDDYLQSRIDAKKITWQDSVWLLENGYERIFTEEGETAIPFERRIFKSSTLLPVNIAKQLKIPEEMSYAELKDFIREVERNGADPDRWRVDLYLKIALPFANFIIVLFGSPLSSSQTRRSGTAKGFGISLAVTFFYFGILKTTQAMGHNGKISPMLAAWFANIVFGVVGIIVLLRARK
ncbi:LPS export ABC transporter permease LptG [candidate division KSB1 bacterium]|nr:LPS export ABC transporter permease LptG [candidate division KSB1 bacterium]RQW06089.1 MAG: LPS export ABC transporter permease LptG [candidate division KSB1 bacterium]